MHREAQLRRSDLGTSVAEVIRPQPVAVEAAPLLGRAGHWNGWELFVRLLVFATRNNHR
jgi:hypothetical protein